MYQLSQSILMDKILQLSELNRTSSSNLSTGRPTTKALRRFPTIVPFHAATVYLDFLLLPQFRHCCFNNQLIVFFALCQFLQHLRTTSLPVSPSSVGPRFTTSILSKILITNQTEGELNQSSP